MQNKTVFLLLMTGFAGAVVPNIHAEYMEPHLYESRTQECDDMNIEVSYDTIYEPTQESSTREEQTRADDDLRVQSCIAEAIVDKYCS
jgi:hypothetical protein